MTLDLGKPRARANRAARRALRGVLLALLLSLLFGLLIGFLIRLRLERPVRFIGRSVEGDSRLASAPLPLDLGYTRAAVFDASHHEQEIGQAVQVAQRGGIDRIGVMQGDDLSFGPTTHRARQMEGRSRMRTTWEDEAAQRFKFRLEGIDARFEFRDVGVRGLGDAARLATRRIG